MDPTNTPKILALEQNLGRIGGAGLGPFSNIAGENAALTAVGDVASGVIGIMTIAAGIWFLFQFMVGGIGWITAGGDKAKLTTARDRLTNAFIGFIIVVAGWSIMAIMQQFLGVDILLTNPGTILQNLAP